MLWRISDLQIARKGLALVLVPLVLSLLFLGVLRFLLNESEAQTRKEKRLLEIQLETNRLGTCFYKAMTTVSTLIFLHDEALFQHFGQLKVEDKEHVEKLRELVRNNKEALRAVDSFAQSDARAFELLSTLSDAAIDDDANRLMHIEGVRNELESVTKAEVERLTVVSNIIAREDTTGQNLHSQNWKQILEWFVYVGSALSIAVSLMLARFFSREITDRLKIIVGNTVRVTSKKELLPVLDGKDEIAFLDQSIHDMARSLYLAEEAKREFVAMLTHDLRNPLTGIGISLEALQDQVAEPAAGKKIAQAQNGVSRLLHMINDLLDLERLDAGKMPLTKEVVLFAEIVDRSIDAVQSLAEKNAITLKRDIESGCEAFADGERLVRVFVNILANAIKVMPPQGTITISCKEIDQHVRVEISDNGPGIPESELNTVFDKYKQVSTTGRRSGSGLGLAVCKAIVESHGGEIGVTSQVGVGSTFWFNIPCGAEEPAVAAVLEHDIGG